MPKVPRRPKRIRKYTSRKFTYKKMRLGRASKYLNNKSIVNLGLGLPKKVLVTHKYVESFSITGTTGAINLYSFSTNGLYDPNITGAGHQPIYFDQFSALYDHYCVIASKMVFKIMPSNASQTPIKVAYFINDDTSLATSQVDAVAEQSLGKFIDIPAASNNTYTGRMKWGAKKFFGKGVLSNTDLQGTSSTNPTEQSNFTLVIQALDGSSTVSCLVQVWIEYITVWKELKDVAQS